MIFFIYWFISGILAMVVIPKLFDVIHIIDLEDPIDVLALGLLFLLGCILLPILLTFFTLGFLLKKVYLFLSKLLDKVWPN